MLDRHSFQEKFVGMLKGDDGAVTPWLDDPAHERRLRVYRNNMVTAWADTIVKNYPAVERLVGTEFMRGAAIAFVRAQPPEDPVMTLYGAAFADFIQSFEPAKSLPYLADVARLDRAWTEAFYAAPAEVFACELEGLSEDEQNSLRVGLHPSVRLLASQWNAHEIWIANRLTDDPPRLKLKETASGAMVWWSPKGMTSRSLSVNQFSFLVSLGVGKSVGEALEEVGAEARAESLQILGDGLSSGAFIDAR